MNFDIGVACDVGVKRLGEPNQDTVGVYRPESSAARPPLLLVADGMGGHNGGSIASQVVMQQFIASYERLPLQGELLQGLHICLDQAHQTVKRLSEQKPGELAQMGSTLVAVMLTEDFLHLINVGDSRAYLINPKGITQISQDQTVVAEGLRAGIITPAEAEVHPKRHILSMSVSAHREAVKGYVESVKWSGGDAVLICSDGLWNVVSEENIWQVVCTLPPQVAVEKLVELAKAAGGPDNISVIVARRAGEKLPQQINKLPKNKTKSSGLSLWIIVALVGLIVVVAAGLATLFIKPGGGGGQTEVMMTSILEVAVTEPVAPSDVVQPSATASLTPAPTYTVTLIPSPTLEPTLTEGMVRTWDLDGATLVYIPATTFAMGPTNADLRAQQFTQYGYLSKIVEVAGFWMDQTEVTNAMYRRCVGAGKCQPPLQTSSTKHPEYFSSGEFDQFPVMYVNYDMAKTYCEWAGRRLPFNDEWELAARGTDGRHYPWGDLKQPDCALGNFSVNTYVNNNLLISNCVGDATEIGKYQSGNSPFDINDMVGNVSEWVTVRPTPLPEVLITPTSTEIPAGMSGAESRGAQTLPDMTVTPTIGMTETPTFTETPVYILQVELRGGDWNSVGEALISFIPLAATPDQASENIGFRCVVP
jgi:serine/threonine protein phosphatase PrpC/formylglycine-generating enzyme required for sulfatase activity